MSDDDKGALFVVGMVWGIPILALAIIVVMRTIKEYKENL